jgi:hypothetical protein
VRIAVALSLIFFSGSVFSASLPSFDIKAACSIFNRDEESEISSLYQDCLDNEGAARDHLLQTVSGLSDEKVKSCTDLVSKEAAPSYLALLGCIGQASGEPLTSSEPSIPVPKAPQSSSPSSEAGPGKNSAAAPALAESAKPGAAAVAAKEALPVNGQGFQFTHDLGIGAVDPEVKELQIFLNTHDAQVAADGPGAPGKEVGVFGPSTEAALIKFQESHKSEILAPAGISKATGFFGATTRRFVNGFGTPPKARAPQR